MAPAEPAEGRVIEDGTVGPEGRFAARSDDLDLWVAVRVRDGRVAEVRLLEDRPPGARVEDHALIDRVLDHLARGRDAFDDVPVDLSAVTSFQRRVLEALRAVPPGETVTYGQLAERVGRPGAARAVGGAVAANPVPVVVPCHRVVAADGGLGGYSGGRGAETKARLLRAEGVGRASYRSPPP